MDAIAAESRFGEDIRHRSLNSQTMPGTCSIILAEDHPILRSGMKSILESSGEFVVIGEAGNGIELLDLFSRGIVPDALIIDLTMPKMSGFEALRQIRQKGFSLSVLVLTLHRERDLLCRSFQTGADGYMLKDWIAKELISAIRTVLENKIYLSPLIKSELPEACRIRANEGIGSARNVPHCAKSTV
jgi:DNA-binding NarL/FixJ family response regulator